MNDTSPFKVLGICGSLRKASLNAGALRAAIEVAPEGITVTRAEIGDLPLYNADVQAAGFPAPVERLCGEIAAADAVLFVTPEYNYSIPGVLKNAIDWVSRWPDQPFAGKAGAVMGASPGALGTGRCQYHLRQCAVFLNLHMMNRPEVMIGGAGQKFDSDGNLTDTETRERIAALLDALRAWAQRLGPPPA